MQRQAVPLSRPEKCIVGTGLERQAALDSGALAIAKREGKIIYTDTEKILFSAFIFGLWYVIIDVFVDSPRDSLQFIEWSPTSSPRVLLIVNFHGRITIWTQPSQVC
ncbi:RNA polymerase beta subunit [Olea europaea subsp. europaea]|uniref:RNA polymerase beta subunit (Chloroplast) n=1 Tax=Olea europaea subsp. europaea TaxID=158383 RepID=A0A8S0PNU0_OLEEU|nr:RNA polymerase beta subunit [Olea europaea subsp. europaea]